MPICRLCWIRFLFDSFLQLVFCSSWPIAIRCACLRTGWGLPHGIPSICRWTRESAAKVMCPCCARRVSSCSFRRRNRGLNLPLPFVYVYGCDDSPLAMRTPYRRQKSSSTSRTGHAYTSVRKPLETWRLGIEQIACV